MRELFEVSELVRIGVEDEKSGVAFYQKVAEKVSNDDLKKLFADLANQEKYHQKRFEQMLKELGGHTQKEEYPGQYTNYLRALTSERAFPDPDAAIRQADAIASDAEAVDLASRFERDTLILMNEMRSVLPVGDKSIIDELVREEQQHLVSLADARRMV